MNNIEALDDIIENKFSFKSLLSTLKQFLEVEFCFLVNAPSLNPSKIPDNSFINISSIENYFTFPKIFLKCVFNALDMNKKNKLTFDEYVNGFLKIYTGNLEEKLQFVFNMFNLNKDKFIYYEDVHLILNYTMIYDNKSQLDKMNSIINSFFGNRKFMDYNLFSQRTFQNNYGLFIIVLAIIFEHSNFNKEFTFIFEESYAYKKHNTTSTIRKQRIINTNVSNTLVSNNPTIVKYNNQSLYAKMGTLGLNSSKGNQQSTAINSHIEVSDYIKANYSIDLYPLLFPSNLNQTNNIQLTNHNNYITTSSNYLYNYNLNSLNFDFKSSHSRKKSNESFESQEFDEDIMELIKFETDYLDLKSCLLFEEAAMNKLRIPIGSGEFILKNGVILSNQIKSPTKSKFSSSLFHFISHKNIHEDKTPKFSASGGNSPLPENLINNNYKNISNNNSNNRGNNFTELMKGTQISQNFFNDIFEEDVYIFNKNRSKIKHFSLFMIKDYILVSGKKNEKVTIKYFIPLKNCYIGSNNEVINFEEVKYYQLILISTIQFRKRRFQIFFEKRGEVNNMTNLIIKETNYTVISNDYTFIKDIGRGTFSQLKLMKHNKTNLLYAIKKINKNVSSIDEYKTLNWEKDIVNFLMNYSCKNIIKFYKIIETVEHLYIIQEYIESGSLSNFIRKNKICLPSKTVKKIAEQVINGVKELHEYGIIHRDLKLENILIDYSDENNFKIKLIDFGLSVVLTSKARTNENYGTFIYSSPEVLLNLPYNNKIDCWSLGIIFFYLEYTFLPFNIIGNENENEQGIANKIVINELKLPKKIEALNNEEEQNSKKIMAKIITECLNKNLNSRVNIFDLDKIVKGEIKS